MKFDFVEPVAVAVVALEDRRIAIGGKAECDGLWAPERGAQAREFTFRPARPLTRDRLAQHGVAGEKIVGLKRRRLVCDLEHHTLVIPGRGPGIHTPSVAAYAFRVHRFAVSRNDGVS